MGFKHAKNRIVVGDINTGPYRVALSKFRSAGWDVAAFANCQDLITDIKLNPPRILVTNLMLYNGSGLKVLDTVLQTPKLSETKVLVVSSFANKENIKECFKRGAKDFLITPFPPENLYRRLIYHLQQKTEIQEKEIAPEQKAPSAPTTDFAAALQNIMECLHMTVSSDDPHGTLHQITKNMGRVVNNNRCSVIIAEPGADYALVVASSDDHKITGLNIDLNKYPEVAHVMNTGLIVIVDDISKNPLTKSIKDNVKTIDIANIMVLPIRFQGDVIGVVSLRGGAQANPFSTEVARICQAIGNASSPVVKAVRDIMLDEKLHGANRKVS